MLLITNFIVSERKISSWCFQEENTEKYQQFPWLYNMKLFFFVEDSIGIITVKKSKNISSSALSLKPTSILNSDSQTIFSGTWEILRLSLFVLQHCSFWIFPNGIFIKIMRSNKLLKIVYCNHFLPEMCKYNYSFFNIIITYYYILHIAFLQFSYFSKRT